MMNKVLMGRGFRRRKCHEVEKQSVLKCSSKEHWGKRIILKVWLILQRRCSEWCFLRFGSYSIIVKWFEAGVLWKFMAIIQEEEK